MSGQMKTLIDRMNGMYEQDYAFRDIYLLTTAAEDEAETPKRTETGLTKITGGLRIREEYMNMEEIKGRKVAIDIVKANVFFYLYLLAVSK